MKKLLGLLCLLISIILVTVLQVKTEEQKQEKREVINLSSLELTIFRTIPPPLSINSTKAPGIIYFLPGVVNTHGYGTSRGGGSDACLSGACFSWFCTDFADISSCYYTALKAPISIKEFQEVAKSLSEELKKSKTLRIDSKMVARNVEKSTTFDLTQSKTLERSETQRKQETFGERQEVDISLRFFNFVSKAFQPLVRIGFPIPIPVAQIYWGGDSALQLILRAYYQDPEYLKALIKAFYIYQNLKPEDIDIRDESLPALAKYSYARLVALTNAGKNFKMSEDEAKDYLWAMACLNVALYSDREFKELRNKFLNEFNKVLTKYNLITTPGLTAESLYSTDKDLAFRKWLVDKELLSKNQKISSDVIDTIKDRYLVALTWEDVNDPNLKAQFEQAIKNKDKTVQVAIPRTVVLKKILLTVAKILGVVIGVVVLAGIIIFRKKLFQKNISKKVKN